MITYILIALSGYLTGSVPTAYIVLKYFHNIDITKEGSKNVGTLNSLRVSNSKIVAFFVLLVDISKGFLSVYLAWQLFGESFLTGSIALLFSVIGHCYSVWINFKGGRGIATSGGGGILLSHPVIILWVIFWIVTFLFRKNVHLSTVLSSVLTGILSITSAKYLNQWSSFPAEHLTVFTVSVLLILLLITIKHLVPLIDYFKNQNKKIRNNR